MFENVSKIKFVGAAFATETTLEFYRQDDERMCLIYGRNGSGKSTIAKAFAKIRDFSEQKIISASLLDKNNNVVNLDEEESKHIYIFDEDYIQGNIRLKKDGLRTIVILGQQGDWEDKITVAREEFNGSEEKCNAQKKVCEQYNSSKEIVAPAYYIEKMKNELSGDARWAGRERNIMGLRQNSPVSNHTYKKIVQEKTEFSEAEVELKFREKFALLQKARQGDVKIIEEVPVTISEIIDLACLEKLLALKLERPFFTKREEYLLKVVESGRLQEIQNVFSSESTTECPFCCQPVTSEYKSGLLESIKKVLSQEVEKHQAALKKFHMELIQINLDPFINLNPKYLDTVKNACLELNEAIKKCNDVIQEKINNPFSPIKNFSSGVLEKRKALIEALVKLENERKKYNAQFDDIEKQKKELKNLNNQKAYYEIKSSYESYCKQERKKNEEDSKLERLTNEVRQKKYELDNLIDQQKSINIAVDLINQNLSYVFFTKNRLEIKSSNGVYSLLSNGVEVKPADISVGERNVIALCYFFVDMLFNLSIQDGYSNEMLVIIDDPISSFDFENRVGIMSFLQAQMKKLLGDNPCTKLLVLTHDLSSVFKIERAFADINNYIKIHSQKKCSYQLMELDNKVLKPFSYRNRHEYTELLKSVFEYAQEPHADLELTIGNTMRRTLEAFFTFIYKKNIDAISYDSDIQKQLGNPVYVSYFENLMYRLVLNGESHLEERARSLIDPEFTAAFSQREKQRIAQDIICFIYLLNPIHVRSHLTAQNNVEKVINGWCERIQKSEPVQYM